MTTTVHGQVQWHSGDNDANCKTVRYVSRESGRKRRPTQWHVECTIEW